MHAFVLTKYPAALFQKVEIELYFFFFFFNDGFLVSQAGLQEKSTPFLSLVNSSSGLKKQSFKGINFAPTGAGIFDITGQSMVRPLSFQKP